MSRHLYIVFALIFAMTFFAGCGKKTQKKEFTADQYFEYAKGKFDKGKYYDAITEFTVITLRYSNDPIVDDAQYYLAEAHFKQKEYLIAISEYQKLINDYPQSTYAILAQFKIGLSYYRLSLRPELDQEFTRKSIRAFQEFVEEHPTHELKPKGEELISKLRNKLAHKQLTNAATYRKMGENGAAVIYYDLFLEKFYDTKQAAEAYYWKAECEYKLKRYQDALSSFSIYIEKYPQHENADKAKDRIGELSDLVKVPENPSSADAANND